MKIISSRLCLVFILGIIFIRYFFILNFQPNPSDLSYFNNKFQRVEIIGRVNSRVEERIKNNRLIIEAEKIQTEKGIKNVSGRLMVFAPKLIEVNYGARIQLSGQLERPEPLQRGDKDKSSSSRFASAHVFNWPMYLANNGIRSVMFSPWITIIEEGQGSFIVSQVYFLNSFFQDKINRFLPYPESAILGAMLLGNQGEIPDKINHSFRQTGIVHILSISGLHITIISVIFFWLILSLGLWRKHAFILTSLFLFFYILMIGAPPYAIRAGIMGFLLLLAQYLGRLHSFQNAIIVAALIILIFNPLSLFYDISFQFSFISILALFLLFPLLQRFFYKKLKLKKEKRPMIAFCLDMFLASLAVLLFLGPLIVYYFGNFPVMSLLVNFFIVPILPFILIFGIIALLVSLISFPLSLIFSSFVYLSLFLMIKVNDFFASLPFLEIFQFSISIYLLILYYIILLALIFKIKKEETKSPLFLASEF